MEDLFHYTYQLITDPLFASFLIVGLGLLLGAVRIKGVSLGVSGVFIVGMIFGLFNIVTPKYLTTFGLLLFLYVLGIQGGASFFNSISKKGIPYLAVTFCMMAVSIIVTFIGGRICGLKNNDILGFYTGIFNNASGLAILLDNPTWGDSLLPSYGLIYPIGAVATVFAVQLIPAIIKKNVQVEFMHTKNKSSSAMPEKILTRKFFVESNKFTGKTLAELDFRAKTGATIERIRHKGKITIPTADTVLYENDIIKVNASEAALEEVRKLVGEESFDDLSDPTIVSSKIVMTNHTLHHVDLIESGIAKNYEVIIIRVERAGIIFTPSVDMTLELGDILTVVGKKHRIKSAEKFIGKPGVTSAELDLISMALGVAIGMGIGKITIPLPFLSSFTLGMSGGALFAGLFMGYIRRFGILTNQISEKAKNVIKDIGISFFMAGVGASSGMALSGTAVQGVGQMIILGIIMLIATIGAMFALCYVVMKMDLVKSLAILCGGMFQSPAITTLTGMVKSDEPMAYFATCYPLATFGSIIATQILAQILIL